MYVGPTVTVRVVYLRMLYGSTFVLSKVRSVGTSVVPYERTTDSRVQLYVYSTVHVPSKQLLLNNPKKKSQWVRVRVRCTVHGYTYTYNSRTFTLRRYFRKYFRTMLYVYLRT
jgi:hypothetical protein